MANEPFIFIGTHRIKPGKLDEFKRGLREILDLIEQKEPQLIAFDAYLDEDATEAAIVQVHPDADSMRFHMQVVGEHIVAAAAYLETERIDIFGALDDDLLESIKAYTQAPVVVKREPAGGVVRSAAQPMPIG